MYTITISTNNLSSFATLLQYATGFGGDVTTSVAVKDPEVGVPEPDEFAPGSSWVIGNIYDVGSKLRAIKALRNVIPLGLKECKEIIDQSDTSCSAWKYAQNRRVWDAETARCIEAAFKEENLPTVMLPVKFASSGLVQLIVDEEPF